MHLVLVSTSVLVLSQPSDISDLVPFDEQHRCMGLNSRGFSKVSVIDAAGVKQVEHK